MSRPRTRLYLITPPRTEDIDGFATELLSLRDVGDLACVQIRQKRDGLIDLTATRAIADKVMRPLQEAGIAVVINDSLELAAELGADGVHLGPRDTAVKEARTRLGPDAIIGASAKASRHAAMLAGEAGADYVAFGAFYPTPTKQDTTQADPELLTLWQEQMELPCVAIGGITPENAAPLVRAGADFIAASSGVWSHPEGPAAAVRAFNALFDTLHAEATAAA